MDFKQSQIPISAFRDIHPIESERYVDREKLTSMELDRFFDIGKTSILGFL